MLRYVKRNNDRTWFERPEGMPEALHQLLIERGIGSAAEAEAFLKPGPGDLTDPMRLSDMAEAVAHVRAARQAGKPICIWGDYDVDGVCASALLKLYLERLGEAPEVYLPSRHTEGYGLNEAGIREIAGRAGLLLTVDCGVTSIGLVALAKSLGLDVVVTDHHRPVEAGAATADLTAAGRLSEGFVLPDCPVVNPLLGGYPFPHLCGAGVAWKLVWALSGQLPVDCVDIAALATVADVVRLTGENRAIVRMGLDRMNRQPRPGIAALIQAAGLSDRPLTATAIAFQLAPRLNAGGRLDTARRPFELVTAGNPAEARSLAEALDEENTRRRQIEQQILREAEAQLRSFDFIRHRAIILAGKGWNPGVIGLAASRLVEAYHYPVVMLADQGERMTGSCRSIEGVDIHAALTGCAAHLERYGGHRQAAGLTLLPEKLPAFIEAMDEWLEANVDSAAYIPTAEYDAEIDLEQVTPALVAALEGMQPTGFGNPAPVFRARAEVIEARAVGAAGAHLKLTLSQDHQRLGGIAFREGGRAAALSGEGAPVRVDALFVPKLNTYMGRTSAQLEFKALSEADPQARIAAKLGGETALQCDFLTEILYNKKIPSGGVSPEAATPERLERLAAERPQGTLLAVGELAAASRWLRRLEPAPDLYFGALPEDPRCFNAICVCPASGVLHPGYRRIVLAGVPEEWLRGQPAGETEGRELLRLDEQPAWAHRLPDIDGLRRVYRALMALCQRPLRYRGFEQLAHLTGDEAEMDTLAALAAILAIADMGLFEINPSASPPVLRRLPRKKAEPEDSAVWRAIQRWRQGIM